MCITITFDLSRYILGSFNVKLAKYVYCACYKCTALLTLSYIAILKFRITLVVALVARLTPPGELFEGGSYFFNGCPDGGVI